jgi:uncharacterized protein (DUF58 family)
VNGKTAAPRRSWNPLLRLRASAERRFEAWMSRNLPPSREILLSQRNVFIFPTREGLGLGLVIVMLVVGAINYQNSLVYLLAFLLGGMFIACILATFRNLSGVRLAAGRAYGCHAGEHAQFEVRLESVDGRARYGIIVGWRDEERLALDLGAQALTVSLGVQARQRGRLRPGRLLIESFHPMGLIRTWSWLDLDCEVIVYPQVRNSMLPPDARSDDATKGQLVSADGDDLYGLREYRMGDVPRAIAWKHYASTGQLRTKEFASGIGTHQRWLNWQDLPGVGVEERLQRLTGWVLTAARSDRPYGVRIPGAQFPPASGEGHRTAVLTALALYGDPTAPARARRTVRPS